MNKYAEFLTNLGEINYILSGNIPKDDVKVINDMFIEKYPDGREDIIAFWCNAEEYRELQIIKKRFTVGKGRNKYIKQNVLGTPRKEYNK